MDTLYVALFTNQDSNITPQAGVNAPKGPPAKTLSPAEEALMEKVQQAEGNYKAIRGDGISKPADVKRAEKTLVETREALTEERKRQEDKNTMAQEATRDSYSLSILNLPTIPPPTIVKQADNEVKADSYSRAPTKHSDWENVNAVKANKNEVKFKKADQPWGTITHFAVFTTPTGGHPIFTGRLTQPVEVNTGDTLTFAPGSLTRA